MDSFSSGSVCLGKWYLTIYSEPKKDLKNTFTFWNLSKLNKVSVEVQMTAVRSVLYYLCVFQFVFHSRHAFLLWHTYLLCAYHYWSFIYLPAKIHRRRDCAIIMTCIGKFLDFATTVVHLLDTPLLSPSFVYGNYILHPIPPATHKWFNFGMEKKKKNRYWISTATSMYIHCLFK